MLRLECRKGAWGRLSARDKRYQRANSDDGRIDFLIADSVPRHRPELEGEAGLTLGGALHEWRAGLIDGAVSVGPLECMPNKIAEAQFFHAAEREGLASLTLSLNGDPVDPELLDRFAYEVRTRRRRREPSPNHSGRSLDSSPS